MNRVLKALFVTLGLAVPLLAIATWASMRPVADDFRHFSAEVKKYQIVDRNNHPLNLTYDNKWNYTDSMPIYKIPVFLQNSFILAEDKNFYRHHGVDWEARFAALYQDSRHFHIVRGASTITEQVVKMLHPRPRNFWSRWVEGFEAAALENNVSKSEILEFYLNQVPYTAKRRGVVQASRYYFGRDLTTLNDKEMLTLAVLPRSPSRLDIYKDDKTIQAAVLRLGSEMQKHNYLNSEELAEIEQSGYELGAAQHKTEASNFINFVNRDKSFNPANGQKIITTLDAQTQEEVQNIINQRLETLKNRNVGNAGALVVDNNSGEIIAWVVGGSHDDKTPYGKIDTVTSPRQPGSSLKPFLYTLALDSGWTPATIIDDAPYSEAIGAGLHDFNNYSHSFYGKVSLREALGNSLNIPALHTIEFVGVNRYLNLLHKLGFKSLDKDPDFYNEGLALGNGEVTLYELVQAYTALANHGIFRELVSVKDNNRPIKSQPVYTIEAASLIGNILSDPWARRLEFGNSSVLNLPVQTAVKTGTSTDYRDAWAVGFNYRYTVGVWMGNLDRKPMNGVTGSLGPALALRSIFSELNKNADTRDLYLSPKLILKDICIKTDTVKTKNGNCYKRSEYFMPGTDFAQDKPLPKTEGLQITRPSNGLNMAVDPRLPPDKQVFEFALSGSQPQDNISWILDGNTIGNTQGPKYKWQLSRGKHDLQAIVLSDNGNTTQTEHVKFWVK